MAGGSGTIALFSSTYGNSAKRGEKDGKLTPRRATSKMRMSTGLGWALGPVDGIALMIAGAAEGWVVWHAAVIPTYYGLSWDRA